MNENKMLLNVLCKKNDNAIIFFYDFMNHTNLSNTIITLTRGD